jgi:hypothetical protein
VCDLHLCLHIHIIIWKNTYGGFLVVHFLVCLFPCWIMSQRVPLQLAVIDLTRGYNVPQFGSSLLLNHVLIEGHLRVSSLSFPLLPQWHFIITKLVF